MFMKSCPVEFAILEVSPVTLAFIEDESKDAPARSSPNDAIPEPLNDSKCADDSASIDEVSVVTPSFIAVASEVTPSFISDELILATSAIEPVEVATFSDIVSVSADTFS